MNLIKYLPVENIVYKTKLKEDEVITRLSDSIEPEKIFRVRIFVSTSSKTYEGKIDSDTFYIKRLIRYRNSFFPRIRGVISRESDKTIIKVNMRLNSFISLFLYLWCFGIGLSGLALFAQSFVKSELYPFTLIPFGMLLFAYILTISCFKFESNKSKKDLIKIFDAEIIE